MRMTRVNNRRRRVAEVATMSKRPRVMAAYF
jgi:hypothetical protein